MPAHIGDMAVHWVDSNGDTWARMAQEACQHTRATWLCTTWTAMATGEDEQRRLRGTDAHWVGIGDFIRLKRRHERARRGHWDLHRVRLHAGKLG